MTNVRGWGGGPGHCKALQASIMDIKVRELGAEIRGFGLSRRLRLAPLSVTRVSLVCCETHVTKNPLSTVSPGVRSVDTAAPQLTTH